MLDLDLVRHQPDKVRDSVTKRFGDSKIVDQFLELDEKWRELLKEAEQLRAERNTLTASKETAQANAEKLKKIKENLTSLEERLRQTDADRSQTYLLLPQLLADDVPVGEGESANQVIRTVGTPEVAKGKSHEELMIHLDWVDFDTAAAFSGSRFRYLKKEAALAHLKLMTQAISFAVENGFTPVIPPVIVKEELLVGGGFFPTGKEDTFAVEDRFLTGTSEPTLVALAAKQTLPVASLPMRFIGFSTCFRREAGSYGKDVRGMFRQHQFDKVEMVSICSPEESVAEHQFLLEMQEKFIKQFDLPYQVVLIGSGDVESKSMKRFDIESWFPGQEKYRETHSVSNCGDYQARRLGIKVKTKGGDEVYAHTLNGTLATERLLLALIENNQKEDGSVSLPQGL